MTDKLDNFIKLRATAKMMAFLMPHQEVLPDLKEVIQQLRPADGEYTSSIDHNTDVYLMGAYDALSELIDFLKTKGYRK